MHVIKDVNKIKLPVSATVRDAARIIQMTKLKIVLVCNEQDQLIGAVTDGDIRRAILQSLNAEIKISEIMNKRPVVMQQDKVDVDQIYFKMRDQVIRHMPIVNENNQVIKMYFYDEFEDHIVVDNPVVLMAGGYGNRLKPLTNNKPKPLIEIGGKPIILHIIELLAKQGFWNFYISVNYLGQSIIDYLGHGSEIGVQIQYLCEDKPLGTAGCLSMIKDATQSPLLVINGDLLAHENFCRVLACFEADNVIASMGVKEYIHTVPFGQVNVINNRVVSVCEKPTHKYLINAGAYILSSEVLSYVPKNMYLDMPDLFERLIKKELPIGVFQMHEEWIDIGQMDDLNKARAIYKEKDTIEVTKSAIN